MTTETYTVHNMSCGNCAKRVQKALAEIDGVSEASVSLESKSATITFDEAVITKQELKETVDDLGYELLLP